MRPTDEEGFVYGITHPRAQGYIKIGRAKNPIRRLKQYQTGCPLRAYHVEFLFRSDCMEWAETCAHKVLRHHRVDGGEWFLISPEDAFELLLPINFMEAVYERRRLQRVGGLPEDEIRHLVAHYL